MIRNPGLGAVELELLKFVSDHHPVTVREAADQFARTQGQARTTVATMLERLREKGYLVREKRGSVYRYAPAESKLRLLRRLVGDFVDRVLGGKLEPFVAYLSDRVDLDDDERAQLEGLVERLDEREEPDAAPTRRSAANRAADRRTPDARAADARAATAGRPARGKERR